MWRWLLRPLFFLLDAEKAHHLALFLLRSAMHVPLLGTVIRRACRPPEALRLRVLGTELDSPVGLAAGFDKDAMSVDALGALGFGFVEVGTLTAQAQPGNPKPRLFRLPKDKALLNRFGFNNGGARAAAERLALQTSLVPVAVNIGRTKLVSNEDAVADYLSSLETLWPHARWIVVNVSSPNTPGLRALQDREPLTALLTALVSRARELAKESGLPSKPMLVKIAPDLSDAQLDDVVSLALETGIDGIVATNTTVSREGLVTSDPDSFGPGGISGAPLSWRSRQVVKHLRERAGKRLIIVGVGGVMSAEDAWAMLDAGADLLQIYTGFIYGGPLFVRHLNRSLAARGLPYDPDRHVAREACSH